MKKRDTESDRTLKPASPKKARRRANVGQPRPVAGEQEPEDGFDMTPLSPKNTGVPLVIYILQDLGIIPEIRVEVAHSTKGSRAETIKVAIQPTVHVTRGHLDTHDLAQLTQWIELNRDALVRYWSGEIEYTEEVLRVLRPLPPR
jgi:hypothetical protein